MSKTSTDAGKSPSEISFDLFRKNVGEDRTLPATIKGCVTEGNANSDLLARLSKAVGEIDAS